LLHCIFFFSSRRRHTISKRDWSSDVCSSDLLLHLTGHATLKVALDIFAPVRPIESLPDCCLRLVHSEMATLVVNFLQDLFPLLRSEERRVGKECRSRCSRSHEKESSGCTDQR